MTRRLTLVIWFVAVMLIIPMGIATLFQEKLREPFFWIVAVALAPFIMSITEYILTGETKKTKLLMGREK